jgi:hypothetical protein
MTKERNIENTITQMARGQRTLAKRVVELEKHLNNMLIAAGMAVVPSQSIVEAARKAFWGSRKDGE